jgi:hypothetical protein
MADRGAKLPRLMNTPQWIFPWREREFPIFPKICAFVLVGLVAAGWFACVRLKVTTPAPMVPRKAALIYLTDDAQGRALAQRAQEGGPFPSRFGPTQWAGMAALENEAFASIRQNRTAYLPKLRELRSEEPPPLSEPTSEPLAVFPQRLASQSQVVDSSKWALKPVLFALSGIRAEELVMTLPPFSGVINRALTSASWRFLIHLRVTGEVQECISLEQGSGAGAGELETWLRGIRFSEAKSSSERWIAVGIGFSNQPVP